MLNGRKNKMKMTTKQAARGKWDGIIAQLLGEQAVTRKHGPCPICGGTDRYRYDNKRNDGDWFCNVCGVGDGFKLLTEALGITFSEAAKRVDQIVNNIEQKPFRPIIDTEKRRTKLNAMWAEATDATIVIDYLTGRDIDPDLLQDVCDLRGHPCLPLFDGAKHVGDHPAMLALIRNAKGEPVSIHRTYIMDNDKQKKIMPPIQTIVGGAVRLGEPGTSLAFAEGIESALSMWQASGIPCWATISAHGMKSIESIPRHVTHVYVCADNDFSYVGQSAAFKLASDAKRKWNVSAEVWMPGEEGSDMNDHITYKADEIIKWRGR